MADFVLVHGAWHGGWCWRRVRDRLEAKGHRVFAQSLTGLSDRAHLLNDSINLDTHVEDVVRLIEWEDLDGFVLCGHSYGGAVITGVAEKIADRIGAIVFLDAYMPRDGQSVLDLSGGLIAETPLIPPAPAAAFHLSGADAAWVDSKCTPQPLACVSQKLRETGAYQRIARKAYVAAAKSLPFPAIADAYERCRADASWRTYQLETGHEVMIEAPDAVTAILGEMA